MERSKWIWMPHAGHFICGHRCQFKLNTYVGKYIVSTVGEMPKVDDKNGDDFDTIGYGRKYETMVYKARKSTHKCCPYEMISGADVDFEGYNKPEDAYAGHLRMCKKYSTN